MKRLVASGLLLVLSASSIAALADRRKADRHLQRGNRYVEAKQYDAAIAEYQAGYGEEPSPILLFSLAYAYDAKGDTANAVEHFRRFLATNSGMTAQEGFARSRVEAFAAQERRDEARAAEARARELENAGRLDEAIAAYLEAQVAGPRPELSYKIGQLHERRRDVPAAIEAYRRAAAGDPTGPIAGEARNQADRLERGVRDAEAAERDRQARAAAARDKGEKLAIAGKHAAAIESYRLAYEIRPDPALLFTIADLRHQAGDREGAIREYRAYIDSGARDRADDARYRIGVIQKQIAADQAAAERLRALREAEARKRDEREQQRAARSGPRTAGWIVGIGGVGLTALGGTLVALSRGKMSEVEDGGLATSYDIQSRADSAQTFQALGYVFGGLGVAAIVTGGVLVLVNRDPGPYEVKVGVTSGPGMTGLVLSGALP